MTPPLIVELGNIFHFLNKNFFGSKIDPPVFVIQIEKKVIFRYVSESHHLIIGSKFASASVDQIVLNFFHEIVHIYNYSRSKIDCTSNQYHNRYFLEIALEIGLYVLRHKTRGWGVTQLEIDDKQKNARIPNPIALKHRRQMLGRLSVDISVINKGKEDIRKSIQLRGTRKICFLKYECACPPPHNSIRSGRRPDGGNPLNATCMVCGQLFTCVEGQ